MSSSPLFDPRIIPSLEGAELARITSIAFFALSVYEWIITLDQEVKLFWSGPWTASRFLFLSNRYLPPMIMLLGLMCFFVPVPTPDFCGPAIATGFILNIAALGVIQAILVLRVWYLFSSSLYVRLGIVLAFVASNAVSLIFAIIASRDLVLLQPNKFIAGCRAQRPEAFWRLFFPSLILHTLLYILTAYKALRNRRILKDAPILKKLLRDGGFFFFVVFVTVGFTSVGSFLTQYPRINIPVIFSNYLIALTSIATSRVMLSIHSLASNLGSDTAWLLNNAELSRAGWRKGSREGEIIVDRWTAESFFDEETGVEKPIPWDTHGRDTPIKMTRIGVYGQDTW